MQVELPIPSSFMGTLQPQKPQATEQKRMVKKEVSEENRGGKTVLNERGVAEEGVDSDKTLRAELRWVGNLGWQL